MTNDTGPIQQAAPLMIPLYEDETVEDLQRAGLRIIQKKDGFRFGEDAVLLAHGVHALWDTKQRGSCYFVEFGSHCGIVSILFSALSEDSTGVGLELSKRQVELMVRNIRLNGLENRLHALHQDIKELAGENPPWSDELPSAKFHFVIANPPYGAAHEVQIKEGHNDPIEVEKQIARYEITINFDEMALAASRLLKSKGRFVFIHRPDRLPEIFRALEKARLMPSQMTMIVAHEGDMAHLVLITATKDGRSGGFRLNPQLVLRNEDGTYSDAMDSVYRACGSLSEEALKTGLYDAGPPKDIR